MAFRQHIPAPQAIIGSLLAGTGLWLVWRNRGLPDESLWLGLALAAWGTFTLLTRERPWARRAQEMIAVLCLLLAGGEWAVRRENAIAQARYNNRLMHFVDDPMLRYEMQPHVGTAPGVTNSLGMLDRERTEAKAGDTVRIACLGDSVGGDFQLPNENACAALEQEMRSVLGGKTVEVLNFSVPGYNSLQEARALEVKALRFHPDAVVMLYVHNDPYPELAISHHLPGHLKFEHLLYSGIALAMARLAGIDANPMIQTLAGLYRDERSWRGVVVAAFDRIAATLRDHGQLPVVIAVFPLFTEPQSPLLHAAAQQVVAEAERHGFIGLDLAPALLQAHAVASLLKPSGDPIHPNALAHRLAAQAIAAALQHRAPQLGAR